MVTTMADGKSFSDMLGEARKMQDWKDGYDDLPKVSRSFSSVKDQDCESGYAGAQCDIEIGEGDQAAFVDGEIACETCFTAAQETRDDFFDR